MNNKIRTLLVLHPPPPYGGGEIQALELMNYLKSNPEYYVFNYTRQNLTRTKQGKFNFRNISFGIYWILKTSYLMLKLRPKKVYFSLPKGFSPFLRNGVVIILANIMRIKVYGELPGANFKFLINPGNIKYKIGLSILKRVDQIRFLTKSIAEAHFHYNLKGYKVIHNGIRKPSNINPKKDHFDLPINLLYIGSLEKSKGLFIIMESIKLCQQKNINVHFNLIGSWTNKDDENIFNNFIRKNNLFSYLTLHGFQTEGNKWEIFNSCDILIHPSFWDGVPLVILEAFSIGLPVISTKVGGIPDILIHGRNGIILEENKPPHLVDAIKYLSENHKNIREISNNNMNDFAKQYELSIFLRNMKLWFEE